MEPKTIQYTWGDFDNDVEHIKELLQSLPEIEDKKFYFVGVSRGGLPLAVTLSNRFESRMGIINYQSYGNGAAKEFSFPIFNPEVNDIVVIVDDIVDTGKTLDVINGALIELGISEIIYVSLFKHENYNALRNKIRLYTCREKLNEWVTYPWE